MRFRYFLAAVLAFLSAAAGATEVMDQASGKLHWRCWYDQEVHISCLVDVLPEAGIGAQLPLPANLPPLVREMWTDPASLLGKVVHIPLLGRPEDMGFTAALSKASVCGSRPDCTVNFTSTFPPVDEMLVLLNRHFPDQYEAIKLALLGDGLDGTDLE